MEIPAAKSSNWQRPSLVVSILVIVSFALYSFFSGAQASPNYAVTVPKVDKLVTTIGAYGSLQPRERYSILSMVQGHVDSIQLRPGDQVHTGDEIIRLVNPKLLREAEKVELSLLGEKASFEKLVANQQMELAKQQARIQLAEYDLTIASSHLSAQEKLAKVNIISAIELQQAQLKFQKATLQVKQEQDGLATLTITQNAEKRAQEYYLKKAKKELELLQKDIENLVIRAGISGVIVKLSSELEEGLNLSEGQLIGQIADPSSLYALLKVQANQASLLTIGQPVNIELKGQKIKGQLQRISPNIENSTVEIEVKFDQALPANTMANTAVTADIFVESQQQTLLVNKLPHINYSGLNQVIVQRSGSEDYEYRQVTVGWVGKDRFQVLNGLSAQDKIVMVDPEQWQGAGSEKLN